MLIPFSKGPIKPSADCLRDPWEAYRSVSKQWLSPWREEKPLLPPPDLSISEHGDPHHAWAKPLRGARPLPAGPRLHSRHHHRPPMMLAIFCSTGQELLIAFSAFPISSLSSSSNPVTGSLIYDLLMDWERYALLQPEGSFMQPHGSSSWLVPCLVVHKKSPAALKEDCAKWTRCIRSWKTPRKLGSSLFFFLPGFSMRKSTLTEG